MPSATSGRTSDPALYAFQRGLLPGHAPSADRSAHFILPDLASPRAGQQRHPDDCTEDAASSPRRARPHVSRSRKNARAGLKLLDLPGHALDDGRHECIVALRVSKPSRCAHGGEDEIGLAARRGGPLHHLAAGPRSLRRMPAISALAPDRQHVACQKPFDLAARAEAAGLDVALKPAGGDLRERWRFRASRPRVPVDRCWCSCSTATRARSRGFIHHRRWSDPPSVAQTCLPAGSRATATNDFAPLRVHSNA